MRKKFGFYLCLIIGIPIIPFIVNFIVTYPNPTNFKVAGDATTWALFYSSFLGAALTAAVAFYVLEKTIVSQNEENRKFREHDRLYNEQLILADLISQIKIDAVLPFINPDYKIGVNLDTEQQRLINLWNNAIYHYNKFIHIFRDKRADKLYESYSKCINLYIDLILQALFATKSLHKIYITNQVTWHNLDSNGFLEKFKKLIDLKSKCDDAYSSLSEEAQEYIDKLIKEDREQS